MTKIQILGALCAEKLQNESFVGHPICCSNILISEESQTKSVVLVCDIVYTEYYTKNDNYLPRRKNMLSHYQLHFQFCDGTDHISVCNNVDIHEVNTPSLYLIVLYSLARQC